MMTILSRALKSVLALVIVLGVADALYCFWMVF